MRLKKQNAIFRTRKAQCGPFCGFGRIRKAQCGVLKKLENA